jgi:hypothetical protein
MEIGLFSEQYDALVADLEGQGYSVTLIEPVEYRGGLPDPQTVYDVTIRLGQVAGSILAVRALIAIVQKHLRRKVGRTGRPRRGCIYLPNGEAHRFDLPHE